MNILFIGTVEFSRRCLLALRRAGYDPLVVTMPEEAGRRRHSDWANLDGQGQVLRVMDVDAEVAALLRERRFDLALVCGWSRLLPLDLAPVMVGSHPSLLPRGRGRHPIPWALILGLKETGLSFFHLIEEPDAGDLVWQEIIPLAPEDDAETLYESVCSLGESAMRQLVPLVEKGVRRPQDHARATYWPKRTERDCKIDWEKPVGETVNLIKGLARPYVGAWTLLDGMAVRIWRARPLRGLGWYEALAAPVGTIQAVEKDRIVVSGFDGFVEILEWDVPSEYRCRPGMRLR